MTVFVSGSRNSHVSDFTGEVGRQGGRSRSVRCSAPFPGLPRSWEGKAAPHFPYGQAFAHLNLPERIPAAPQRLHCADQLEMGMQTPSPLSALCTSSPWGQPRGLSGVKGFPRSTHVFLPSTPRQPLGSTWLVAALESYSYFSAGKGVLPVQGPDSARVLATGAGQQLGCALGLPRTGGALQSQAIFKDKG